ncbi:DUF6194 family protein [Actinotalea fermentans]|uniref:DUF6194 domain-containing protein n=1 Tax=Actinotalea fermentans TaxID=43671 RepID=A0A511YWF1_9CELL|nr:DUF6194 family protein [Actinotalea fermentans]KGM17518.1 hypothetical protein N867_01900 [Actinotalea fermentans ATCC 43279 = JCM 9966 = DSM 3133]GEN79512.1 hypothetical protein AFE02nite_12460 [Actinotalea fermentans]
MDIEEIVDHVTGLGGVLVLRPQRGDGTPEIAWGDLFFFDAPDGRVPHGQPFATVVTKPYPDEPPDPLLARAGSIRLNVDVGRAAAAELVPEPTATAGSPAPGPDAWFRHPVYGALGWVAVVDPGARGGPCPAGAPGGPRAGALTSSRRRRTSG